MRRLKKKLYIRVWLLLLLMLFLIRITCSPDIPAYADHTDSLRVEENIIEEIQEPVAEVKDKEPITKESSIDSSRVVVYHPINSVSSYEKCFPDLQETQIKAARKWGVSPVRNRQEAELRKSELVYVASNPYFTIDARMQQSIPYLVPRAADLLQDIGRAYLDSLYVKGVPLHRILVSSVLRTEEDVAKLLSKNGNASDQSCHRFGTTFDIAYNRYATIYPPGEYRRTVSNDTLKWVLNEVLRDQRELGKCYIKHEVKQGCFHITVR